MTVSQDALKRLQALDPGVVSDCMMRLGLCGWMDAIHPVGGGHRRMVGRARTLLFGPKRGEGAWSKSMYATVASLDPGDVLVFGAGGTQQNLMGDNVAGFASSHGLAGIVTDSTVRDSEGIAELPMPVFARGTAVRLPLNIEPVAFDVPLSCGGAQVRPHDVVIGCEDGVIVLPAGRIGDVLHQAEEVEQIEETLQAAIRAHAAVPEIEALIKRKKQPRPR